ncbi:hypothetical protein [Rhodococcus sp. (in: high G+C Gram-positive bacteria)]|uniref:hypothetical protein n=1 Tax=Rhodococcus sp. TaxID=1831 RepID=UPI000E26F76A|nr:hypothetical protein [Rhodococcus sp. (in: high G+C Gram-positive bacteria)]MBQ7806398.1 hypothetical protein [Rhodococcus sp. (in: high G+C Gram-positive bacteria)]
MRNIALAVQHSIAPLVEPMHEALESARHFIDVEHRGVVGKDQHWLRTANMRGSVFRYLKRQDLGDWFLDESAHGQNGAVHLTNNDGTSQLRVLHASADQADPVAGHSRRRRAYFTNNPLIEEEDLFGTVHHKLLMLWEEPDSESEFGLRVVRTLGPGTYGKSMKTDMLIDMPRTKTDFESLEFVVQDEELDYEIAEDEEEKGNGAG